MEEEARKINARGVSLLFSVPKEDSSGLSCKEVSLAEGAGDLQGPQTHR